MSKENVNFQLYKIELKMIADIQEATGWKHKSKVFREGLRVLHEKIMEGVK